MLIQTVHLVPGRWIVRSSLTRRQPKFFVVHPPSLKVKTLKVAQPGRLLMMWSGRGGLYPISPSRTRYHSIGGNRRYSSNIMPALPREELGWSFHPQKWCSLVMLF